MKDYEESFGSTIIIDKDGNARLTKEELNRVDIMIQRKFDKEIGRQEKITCSVKITPLGIYDKLKAEFDERRWDVNLDYDRQDNFCVFLVVTASL